MPQPTPEYIYVEKQTIEQLKSMGWQHIEGSWDDPQVTERENFKQVLLSDRARAAIKRINLDNKGNPWLDDTQINLCGKGSSWNYRRKLRALRALRRKLLLLPVLPLYATKLPLSKLKVN